MPATAPEPAAGPANSTNAPRAVARSSRDPDPPAISRCLRRAAPDFPRTFRAGPIPIPIRPARSVQGPPRARHTRARITRSRTCRSAPLGAARAGRRARRRCLRARRRARRQARRGDPSHAPGSRRRRMSATSSVTRSRLSWSASWPSRRLSAGGGRLPAGTCRAPNEATRVPARRGSRVPVAAARRARPRPRAPRDGPAPRASSRGRRW